MFKRVLMLTAVVLVFSVCQVQADIVTWDGEAAPGDNGWNRAENWDPDVVPGVSDNVVINMGTEEDEEEIQLQHPDFTIDSLNISGYVGLGAWGLHWIGITITNGLVNNGILEIYTDGWIGLYADVTNATDARLELERIDIEGTFTNETGATVEIWDEAEFIGDLDNYGTIEVDPFSEMWVEGTLYNDSLIQLYGGDAEIEGTLENDENGTIKGFGLIGADETFINSGEIIAEGGTLVLYSEGTFETTGELSNQFVSSLQIGVVADVDNVGTMYVKSGGGIAINNDLINSSGGVIELMGGTLAARLITQKAGAYFTGFGSITCFGLSIETGAEIELTGPTNIIGLGVSIDSGATLIISAGLTLITGHTTNDGTIVLAGGTVIFQGGYSGSGNIINATPDIDGLIGHWQMDDDATNTLVEDSTDYDNDGTAQQNTNQISTAGVVGDALSFNGTSDYITIDGLTSYDNFTYAAWVKFDDLSGIQKIFDGGKFYIRLVVDGSGTHIDAYSSGLSDSYMRMFSFTPQTGRWYHFAYSYDSSSKKFYVDGSLEHQEPATGVMDAFTSMKLGTNSGATNNFFSGSMDNVSIFNVALAEADIEEMYEEVAFLAGYWRLDDNTTDTVVKDSSYKANDGTAQQNTNQISTPGKVGNALSFNGSSDYIAIDGLTTSYDDFTYAAWVKFDNLSGTQKILDGGKFYIRLVVDGSGTHIDAYSSGLSDSYMRMFSFTPVTGEWYHFAYTYDGSEKKFYVDGSLEHQESATGVMDAFTSMKLGTNRWATNNFFNGSMDNVMIFNEALTEGQIQEVYNE